MNKVSLRCQKQSNAKLYYASTQMFNELKILKITLYILAVIPVILQLIPIFNKNAKLSFLYTIISFAITILTEILSSFNSKHKKNAILEHQLYESEVTGSTFSKIEYDRETTNQLNELGIRKGLKKCHKNSVHPEIYVPNEISDDYSYLFICRKNAATTNFLLSRIFVIYSIIIAFIIVGFIGCIFLKDDAMGYIQLIIGFYPLILPFIKDCISCREAQRDCVKICADIDNFFADGDASVERLARFYYYVQNLEYEMMIDRPTIYNLFKRIFRSGTNILQDGVTYRFKEAVDELIIRSSGFVHQPKGKSLITKVDFSMEDLERKQLRQKELQRQKRLENRQKKLEEEKLQKSSNITEESKPITIKKVSSSTTKSTTTKSTSTKKTTSSNKPKTSTAKKTTSTVQKKNTSK